MDNLHKKVPNYKKQTELYIDNMLVLFIFVAFLRANGWINLDEFWFRFS